LGDILSKRYSEGKDSIGKLKVFRYTRIQIDYRYTKPVNRWTTIATRFNVGVVTPLGLSKKLNVLPYEKYFFTGGSNSIRAWAPRRLGPGSSPPSTQKSDGTYDYRFEKPGELLFESNFELRQKITGVIDGALFADVGNVWNLTPNPEQPGAEFELRRFYKELAVALGVGVRLDFSFLILRIDVGVKAWDPAYPINERNRLRKLSLKHPLGLPGQRQFNIGIGYPF
jgi:outer membrane protein assembly factor BamA